MQHMNEFCQGNGTAYLPTFAILAPMCLQVFMSPSTISYKGQLPSVGGDTPSSIDETKEQPEQCDHERYDRVSP